LEKGLFFDFVKWDVKNKHIKNQLNLLQQQPVISF